ANYPEPVGSAVMRHSWLRLELGLLRIDDRTRFVRRITDDQVIFHRQTFASPLRRRRERIEDIALDQSHARLQSMLAHIDLRHFECGRRKVNRIDSCERKMMREHNREAA